MNQTALTGVMSASRDLSVISNNLANAMTVGFKRSTSQFVDVIGTNPSERPGVTVGQGTLQQSIRRTETQGDLKTTQSALDLAIMGAGLFTFGDPNATPGADPIYSYSRAGQLKLASNGDLTDSAGRQLLGLSLSGGSNPKPINLLAASNGDLSKIGGISLDSKGVISVLRNDGVQTKVATVALARFTNEDGLKNLGGSIVGETDLSGPAQFSGPNTNGMGDVKQGALEQGNVDMTAELLRMIQAQQAYNGNARALQTGSEMLRSAIETLAR